MLPVQIIFAKFLEGIDPCFCQLHSSIEQLTQAEFNVDRVQSLRSEAIPMQNQGTLQSRARALAGTCRREKV